MSSVEYNEQGNRLTMRKTRTEVAVEPIAKD